MTCSLLLRPRFEGDRDLELYPALTAALEDVGVGDEEEEEEEEEGGLDGRLNDTFDIPFLFLEDPEYDDDEDIVPPAESSSSCSFLLLPSLPL